MKNAFIVSVFLFYTLTGFTEEEGFVPLFNGENLDGWVNVNCAPGTWTVRDGMIVCTGKPTGELRTTKQYQNFVFEMEWKHLHDGGNAGLFIHADDITAKGQPFIRAIEIQVLQGNHGDIFSIHGARMTPVTPHPGGWERALPSEKRSNPAGEWNHYRVTSIDGMVSLAVNGKVVSEAVNCDPRKGYICLESEGSEVHFRNIKIKELPGDEVPPQNTAIADRGFRSLYNGMDFTGWKLPQGSEGHWVADDWIIRYDGKSEAEGEGKHLWSQEEFGNFILIADWRQTATPQPDPVPNILPDGSYALSEDGSQKVVTVLDAGDSGIYLRGSSKCQVNIWNWSIGSGEIWGYRTDESMPPDVRRGATPIHRADEPIGRWNRFVITMIDETITVELNGITVIDNAKLPGVPKRGPIALQHHGDPVEFANIYVKELD